MPSTHGIKNFFKKHSSEEESQSTKEAAGTAVTVGTSSSAGSHKAHTTVTENHHNHHSKSNGHAHAHGQDAKKDLSVPDKEDELSTSASDQKLTRKRSILLNLMLPPEPAPVGTNLSLPPIDMYPPVLMTPSSSTNTTTLSSRHHPTALSSSLSSQSKDSRSKAKATTASATMTTSTTISKTRTMVMERESTNVTLPWFWSMFRSQIGSKETNSKTGQSEDNEEVVTRGLAVATTVTETETETETVSRTVQAKAWISKLSHHHEEGQVRHRRHANNQEDGGESISGEAKQVEGTNGAVVIGQQQDIMTGGLPQEQQQQVQQQQQQHQEIIHQEIHQKTRTVSLVNVNVSDIFGFGKALEVVLAMMQAHGSFLSRQPFWLQCVVLSWEGLMMLLVIWALLRVVGIAEIVVWGADDLVRGTLSTVHRVGKTIQTYFAYHNYYNN